ncbi:Serine/arginine repetitive matrix protein 2 [Rhodotorula diobovata]|uniref:Serine/arginine repetitive matrix protein 2 n=1 Tax=Rhodotorula diobovata TaxID=5288 RepID=A0A5C5FYH4_9BASI|nr:Serine/arginine repetitive matrix protein 2 [Rhodotorula diobovata]
MAESDAAEEQARAGRKLCPINTQSSDTSTHSASSSMASPSSSSSSSKIRFGPSSLHQALSRPGTHHSTSSTSSHHSHSHHKHHPHFDDPTYRLPTIKDPIHLCELATQLLLTVPGVPMDVLRRDIVPRLYHVQGYEHRVNTREIGMEKLLVQMARFRQRFSRIKVRLRSHLMDMDGTSDMHAAAVALVYDITAKEAHPASGSKHDHEEKHCSSIAVMKVYEGKIAQTDLVVDTKEFHAEAGEPELSCVVM